MATIGPPFLVFEGLDLTFYESLDALEQGLEGVDVEEGAYEAFDAMGRMIRLEATGVRRHKYTVDVGKTHVDAIEKMPTGAERLCKLLRNHLCAVGHSMPRDATLHSLVTKCVTVHSHGS